ncbi:MAG: SsrA-binding protein SmpB [bacterium]
MKVDNKKAFFEYTVIEKYEAGISLEGQEVKSIRIGQASLADSFCRIIKDEVFVMGMHITHYDKARTMLDSKRTRKLLLHKREINYLTGKVSEKGFALIPLSLYFNKRGKAKLCIALCKGKRQYEKRETIKNRELEREMRNFKN